MECGRQIPLFSVQTVGQTAAIEVKIVGINVAQSAVVKPFAVANVVDLAVGIAASRRVRVVQFEILPIAQRLGKRERDAVIIAVIGAVVELIYRISTIRTTAADAVKRVRRVERRVRKALIIIVKKVRRNRPSFFFKTAAEQK